MRRDRLHAALDPAAFVAMDGYRMVISQVPREYGDGKLAQPHAGQPA